MGQIINDVEAVLKYKDAKKDAKNERQKILAEMKRIEGEKSSLIKKALATQRAKFGGGGAGGYEAGGAVLKRLESETAQQFDDRLRSAAEKMRKIKAPKMNLLKTFISRFGTLV